MGFFDSITNFLFGSKPQAPATPDYGAAQRVANEWAPIQAQIESAKRMGGKMSYIPPEKQKWLDDNPNYDKGGIYSTIATGGGSSYESALREVDFTGAGDVDVAKQIQEFELGRAKAMAPELLALEQEYGTQFAEQARKTLKVSDPFGFKAREQLGAEVTERETTQLPDPPSEWAQIGEGPSGVRRAEDVRLPSGEFGQYSAYDPYTEAAPTAAPMDYDDYSGIGRRGGRQQAREEAAGYAPAAPPPLSPPTEGDFGTAGQVGDIAAGNVPPEGWSPTGASPIEPEEYREYTTEEPYVTDEAYWAAPGYERAGFGPQVEGISGMGPEFERVSGMGPEIERLRQEDIPEYALSERDRGGRGGLEDELIRRMESGRTARQIGDYARQDAMMQQAGRGNIFGGGATIDRSRQAVEAEEAARMRDMGAYLNMLQSGQTEGDLERRLEQQNLANRVLGIEQRTGAALAEREGEFASIAQRTGAERAEREGEFASIAQRNQARQQGYANQLAGLGQRAAAQAAEEAELKDRMGQRTQAQQQTYQNIMGRTLQQEGLEQQRMSNLQSFAFGAPLTNQLGQLSGLQQQATPYMKTPVPQVGASVNQQAQQAQNFALNKYGTQAGIYGTELEEYGKGVEGFGSLMGGVGSLYGSMGGKKKTP